MNINIFNDSNYKAWLAELKQRIRVSQIQAAIKVNTELLNLYWQIGQDILIKQSQSNWGDSLIDQLAKDLASEFPEIKGFSRTNLFYIRKWVLFYNQQLEKVPQLVGQIDKSVQNVDYEKVPQLVALIPWGHNREIITKTKSIDEALFYVQETIRNNWSRSILMRQIESKLYQRQGKAQNNFDLTLPKPQADLARETLKNPYNFDFLTLGIEAQERDLENALSFQIENFLLELGQGFAFMGRQYNINIGGDDYRIDLLLYHTKLRCYIVIELKVTEFEPEFAGKLNFYLSAIDAELKHPDDQPTIGILLCKTPNKVVVEYALKNISKPLGVAEYQLTRAIPEDLKGELPSIEELEIELERDNEILLKPVDKKLKQMNDLLSSLKEEPIKHKRTTDSAAEIFETAIIPLQKIMENKIEHLRNKFDEIKTTYQVGSQEFTEPEKARNQIANEKNNRLWQLGISFQFNGFKPLGTNTFNTWTKLEIELQDYKYQIGKDKNKPLYTKLYHQPLTKDELNELTDTILEEILDHINTQIERLKQ